MARKSNVAAISEGKRNNRAVAVMVVDAGDYPVYFERIDVTQTGSINLTLSDQNWIELVPRQVLLG